MTAEALALLIAGIVWPFVFQSLQKFGLEDRAAQWAALFTALAVGMLAHVATGGVLTPEALITAGGSVFAISQVVWRQVIKPSLTPPSLVIPVP